MCKSNFLSLLVAGVLGSTAFAVEDYQVTGPVVALTDSKIVVQKGDEKWEIARTADAKITGDLKVGAKVTVHYVMTAKTIEVKGK